MESTSRRATRLPTRQDGHQRVASLLDAAAAVIGERGFAAATMSEIAARADARIGSLYRFFPDKNAIADALVEHYLALILDGFALLHERIASLSTAALADALLDQFVVLRPRGAAVAALLEERPDGDSIRTAFRARMLDAIGALLLAHAPFLRPEKVPDIAALLLNAMKLMARLQTGEAPGGPGTRDELRLMVRLYLETRLRRPET
ncbi:TetR/AcrR family transcriptional regulator [Acetobacteraceae bacterium KSS8]|uniref:TetR/AcrR family transcriptional regulator n=1 Tax=Endosaccharibacter trunci TaxID=2812733 RepID=A0ABT1W688_9PROT|nr:TetR/AcrR family transcriptional regulator [Acetobacteraceae bacterium KSS8]